MPRLLIGLVGAIVTASTLACGVFDSPTAPAATATSANAIGFGAIVAAGGSSVTPFAACLSGSATASCFSALRVHARTIGTSAATAPGAPQTLLASSSGSSVTLTWSAPAGGNPATAYVIEAGSAPNLADLANFSTGNALTIFQASGISAGTYYLRIRAINAAGTSAASNEAVLVVGSAGPCAVPSAPTGLTLTFNTGGVVTFVWTAASGVPTSYVVEAGSQSGLSNLANSDLGGTAATLTATGVGAGTYYVRVRSKNACGISAASNEVVVVVGTTGPQSYQQLLQKFSFVATIGQVRVGSNISVSFSQQHADHASLVWNYFSRIFARSIGSGTEMYYTQDLGLYTQVFAFCPSIVIPGARQVTTCYDGATGRYTWFVVPYIVPDFGTQQHELSHSFLYATYPGSEDFPWIKEGTGMYWEGGTFDGAGNLIVSTPLPYLTYWFRYWSNAGRLLPLTTLVSLARLQFYGSEATLVYSQAGMFIYYLQKIYPSLMTDLFTRLNARTLTNNDQVLAFLISQTGLSLGQLDTAYAAYALRF